MAFDGVRLRYQQLMFRYGQAALNAGGDYPLLSAWRGVLAGSAPAPADDMTPGVMIVQKDARPDGIDLWVGAFARGQDRQTIEAEVTLTGDGGAKDVVWRAGGVPLHWFGMESEGRITRWEPTDRFFHTHVEVAGLAPDRWYRASVRLRVDPRAVQPAPLTATCLVRTLPVELEVGRSLSVLTASCYDVNTDLADEFDAAYRRVIAPGTGPDLTWLCGDAVYLDSPWWIYGTMARCTPRTHYLLKYWTAWGMQRWPGQQRPRPGLRSLLTSGPNWFLPDDHEFWNNWPHKSVTARHSWLNIGKTVVAAAARSRAQHSDPAGVAPPQDPRQAMDPGQQNFLPVHPDEWDAWSRGAFDLFGSFQTRSVRDRTEGRITWGERDDDDPSRPPTATLASGVHAPLNQVVQKIDIDPVRVVLLDTRTRRVRKHHDPQMSTFVDQELLDEVLATAEQAEIFVLVLAQPALQCPVHARRRLFDFFGDRCMQHYWHQYHRFWAGLVERRAGRPTITVGGDVHRSYVAFAEALSLVEIVASPMSLVAGMEMFGGPKRWWRRLTPRAQDDPYRTGADMVEVADLCWEPGRPRPRPVGKAISVAHLPPECAGFATFTINREQPSRFRLDVTLNPRTERCEPVTVSFALFTGSRNEPSVERITTHSLVH